MALARETTIYALRGDRAEIYDRDASLLVFPCSIGLDVIDDEKYLDLDIHHSGRVRVVYASNVDRVKSIIDDQDHYDEPLIAIQFGV